MLSLHHPPFAAGRCRSASINAQLELDRHAPNPFFRSPIHHSVISNVNKAATAALMHKSLVCWFNPLPFLDLQISPGHACTISGVRVRRPTSPKRFEYVMTFADRPESQFDP